MAPSTQPKLQHIGKVITPWPTQDLITLADLKTQLRIPSTDTSKDAELQLIIDGVSAQMARMVNRSFGYDEVQENLFNPVEEDRMYFSQWPVKLADIKTLTRTKDSFDLLTTHGTDWILEEYTGTMFGITAPFTGTVFADYSGGYKIPQEAPADLQRACTVACREDYYSYMRGTVLSGVRMISHKHARVMYYPPGQFVTTPGMGGVGTLGPTWAAVWNVLQKYFRHWV
jgi:hypothetical protein